MYLKTSLFWTLLAFISSAYNDSTDNGHIYNHGSYDDSIYNNCIYNDGSYDDSIYNNCICNDHDHNHGANNSCISTPLTGLAYIRVYHRIYNSSISRNSDFVDVDLVVTCVIASICLILTPIAIYAVYSLVRDDNVAPIYVINLLISDLVQLCAMIPMKAGAAWYIGTCIDLCGLVASVCFMVCIALERYLLIVWPLWYRTRRTVKMSLLLCAVVWTLALFCIFLVFVPNIWVNLSLIFGVLLLLPFPLLVFFLVGTLRALSASISVRAEEKRRIVGLLVLVLLIYTLLFLPCILSFLIQDSSDFKLNVVALYFLRLNPVADLFLYIFLRKGAVNQLWFCLCCCRKNRTSRQSSSGLNDGDTVNSV